MANTSIMKAEALPQPARRSWWIAGLALAAGYALTGRVSLLLAVPPGYAAPIFLPAGLALVAVFVGGPRYLPWIALGAFGVNFRLPQPLASPIWGELWPPLWIAASSAIQAGVGAVLLRRVVGFRATFDSPRTALTILWLPPLICLVGATLSVGLLAAAGRVVGSDIGANWWNWWLGDTLGAIVALPVLLPFVGEPRSVWRRRRTTVALPMLLAIGVLVGAFVRFSESERKRGLEDFHATAIALAAGLQEHFDGQELALDDLDNFLSNLLDDRPITREQFHAYAARILARFPMLQALEWVPRVPQEDRDRFEAAQREQVPGFRIRDGTPDGRLVRASARPEYYPVTYVEPLGRNPNVRGYDLASSPERLAAIRLSSSRGVPVATPPLRLVQEPATGVLLLMSLKGGPNAPGVIATVFRMRDFVENTAPSGWSQFDIRLTDVGTGRSVFGAAGRAAENPTFTRELLFGTRVYRLEVSPTAEYLARHRSWSSLTFLAFGLVGSGFMGSLLLVASGYTSGVEATVVERTEALSRERDKVRMFLRAASDGVHIVDGEGRVIEASDSFCEMLGYSREEVLAMKVWDWDAFFSKDDLARRVRDQTEKEAEPVFQTRHRRKDGSVIDVEVTGRSLQLDGRNVVFNSSRDIGERLAIERTLRESERRFQDIANVSADWIWEIDDSARYTFASQGVVSALGYAVEEIIGRTPFDLMPEPDAGRARVAFERVRSAGIGFHDLEGAVRRKDGSLGRVLTSGTPILDGAGRVLGYRGIARDVTRQREMEASLLRAKEAAEVASRAKSAFLANMSHEIRTPLNALIGLTDVMLESDLTARQQELLRKIELAGKALRGVVNQVLDHSKIEAGLLEVESTPFRVADLFDECRSLFEIVALTKGVELDFALDPAVPPVLLGDALRLQQVISNLVSNALKFTGHGGVSVTAKASDRTEDSVQLEVSVRDTGIGLEPGQIERLFEPFHQADASTTRKYGGSGLGLSICRSLVGLMNGRIGVDSTPGKGSNFWFTVRLGRPREGDPEDSLAHRCRDDVPAERAAEIPGARIERPVDVGALLPALRELSELLATGRADAVRCSARVESQVDGTRLQADYVRISRSIARYDYASALDQLHNLMKDHELDSDRA